MKTFRSAVLFSLLSLFPLAPVQAQDSGVTRPVPFKGIARIHTLKAKSKSYTAESVYPVFRANTRLTRFTNREVTTSQRKMFNDWVKESRNDLKEAPNSLPYEYSSGPTLTYFSAPRLISLRFDSYEFMGGAHGMNIMATRNFGIVNGKPKELSLGDFFKPGSNYRDLVQTKVIAKLKQNPGTDWIHDGSVKTLTNNQFNNFSIDRTGLTWLFNQYEMGSYAEGQFEIKLTPSELGPNFRSALLKR